MSSNLARDFDDFADTETLSVAEVIDEWRVDLRIFIQSFERQQMGPSQIADMDIITHAGAIGSGVIGAENRGMFGAAKGDLQHPGDEMRLRPMGFAFIRICGAGGVEISQAGIVQAVNTVEPGQHAFDQELRFAISIGWLNGIVFFDGSTFGVSVERRGRRKDKTLYL